MENSIEVIESDPKDGLPKDPFDVIEDMDDKLILAEMKGRIVDAWVYHFRDENGREQWGLSKVGVDAACSELAKRGQVIRELEIHHDVDPTDREYILFTAKAGRYAVARDGREVLLDTAFGTKRQSTRMQKRDGSSAYNNFWFEHGSAKALRNARSRLISEEMRASIIAYAREHNKTLSLTSAAPAARPKPPPSAGEGASSRQGSAPPATAAQKRTIAAQTARLGLTEDACLKKFGIKDAGSLSVRQASAIITGLSKIKKSD